jgi:hypothetical protein
LTDRYDYVFWFGDLNYRVNGNRTVLDKLIQDKRFEVMCGMNSFFKVMMSNDQLRMEMMKGTTFQRFWEGPIQFYPTYKFDTLDIMDTDSLPESENSNSGPSTKSSKTSQSLLNLPKEFMSLPYDTTTKARIPSWTDRILYKCRLPDPVESEEIHTFLGNSLSRSWSKNYSEHFKNPDLEFRGPKPTSHVQVLEYNSVPSINVSDHKPVYGFFLLSTTFYGSPELQTSKSEKLRIHGQKKGLIYPENWEDRRQCRCIIL